MQRQKVDGQPAYVLHTYPFRETSLIVEAFTRDFGRVALLARGEHPRPYRVLGAHALKHRRQAGVRFAVWAPQARRVSVVGDFNHWDGRQHPLELHAESGVWTGFVPGAKRPAQSFSSSPKVPLREFQAARFDRNQAPILAARPLHQSLIPNP